VVAVHAVGLLEGQQLRPRPDVAATVAAARALNPGYSDVEVDTVFEDGAPAEIIARIAEDQHAVLIVVGSRGLGRTAHLLGSTSEAVLARATIPVLIVPAGSSPAASVDTGRVS
jgi:nucleotide-binding universal stress UspA family protein